MVEYVSLDKMPVLATLQCKSVTTVCIHKDKLGILFFVEVAVSVHKLIIILVEVFTHISIFLMRLSLVMIELLICFRQGYIEHGAFLLLRFDWERSECSTILFNLRKKANLTLVNDHRAVVVEILNILRELAGRYVFFLNRRSLNFSRLWLFRCRHSWFWGGIAPGFLNDSSVFGDYLLL